MSSKFVEPEQKPTIIRQTAVHCKNGYVKWVVTMEMPYIGPRGKVYSTFTTFSSDSVMNKSGLQNYDKMHEDMCKLTYK